MQLRDAIEERLNVVLDSQPAQDCDEAIMKTRQHCRLYLEETKSYYDERELIGVPNADIIQRTEVPRKLGPKPPGRTLDEMRLVMDSNGSQNEWTPVEFYERAKALQRMYAAKDKAAEEYRVSASTLAQELQDTRQNHAGQIDTLNIAVEKAEKDLEDLRLASQQEKTTLEQEHEASLQQERQRTKEAEASLRKELEAQHTAVLEAKQKESDARLAEIQSAYEERVKVLNNRLYEQNTELNRVAALQTRREGSAESQISRLNFELLNRETSLEMLERNKKAVEEKLIRDKNDLEKIVSKLEDNLSKANAEASAANELADTYATAIEQLQGDMRGLQQQVQDLTNEKTDAASKVARLETAKAQLETDISSLRAERQSLKAELTAAQEASTEREYELNGKDKAARQADEARAKAQTKLLDTEKKNKSLQILHTGLGKDYQKLKAELASKEARQEKARKDAVVDKNQMVRALLTAFRPLLPMVEEGALPDFGDEEMSEVVSQIAEAMRPLVPDDTKVNAIPDDVLNWNLSLADPRSQVDASSGPYFNSIAHAHMVHSMCAPYQYETGLELLEILIWHASHKEQDILVTDRQVACVYQAAKILVSRHKLDGEHALWHDILAARAVEALVRVAPSFPTATLKPLLDQWEQNLTPGGSVLIINVYREWFEGLVSSSPRSFFKITKGHEMVFTDTPNSIRDKPGKIPDERCVNHDGFFLNLVDPGSKSIMCFRSYEIEYKVARPKGALFMIDFLEFTSDRSSRHQVKARPKELLLSVTDETVMSWILKYFAQQQDDAFNAFWEANHGSSPLRIRDPPRPT